MRFIIGCLVWIWTINSFAQSQLDSAYTLFQHDSRGDILAYKDGEIIVVGAARDTTTFNVGIGYTTFDLDGSVLLSQYLFDGPMYLLGLINDVVFNDTVAYVIPVKDPSPTQVLKYNTKNGEVVERIELENNKYDNPVVIAQGMDVIDLDRFAIASVIWGAVYNETQITIYNMTNDSMMHVHNSYPNYNQNIYFIEWRDDKIYLVGDLVKGDPDTPDFEIRTTIVILDTLGSELWRYVSTGLRGFVSDCFIEDNGDVVIAHSFFDLYNDKEWWTAVCRPGISRISNNGSIVWERPLGKDHYNHDGFFNYFKTMLTSTGGDGYIVAGAQSNFSIEQYWAIPFVDTISTGEYLQDDALLAKVSKEGEVVWTRTYSKVSQIYSHDLFCDMVYHPDGGYLISGWVSHFIPGEPLVRTWLLYVDEYGCAVPGCQTVGTTDAEHNNSPMLIYPNPASSELYIYQGDHGRMDYLVMDLQGRVLEQFSGGNGGHTFIVDVTDYPAGIYTIIRSDKLGGQVTEQWVKK